MRFPNKAEMLGIGNWLRKDMAEWAVGSWAKIIAWLIVGVIFFNFLQMDGYFSRGLGENSGVDPTLFQNIGWMFRCFAAVFLTLAVKFTSLGMTDESRKLKWLGLFCTIIIVGHAMGFGLKALEGKRANAVAVYEVAKSATDANQSVIATLNTQKASIRADLAVQTAPLTTEINQYIKDGKNNDGLANSTRSRRKELEDNAQAKIDAIDGEIVKITTATGQRATTNVKDVVTTEKWAPLFVGLAQLATWSENPSDWAIYLCGVIFLMCWILLGDSIVILVPPALYKMHLRDAQRKRMAALGAKGGKTTSRRNRVTDKLLAIVDYSKAAAEATKADLHADPDGPDEMDGTDGTDGDLPAESPEDIDLTNEGEDDAAGDTKAA